MSTRLIARPLELPDFAEVGGRLPLTKTAMRVDLRDPGPLLDDLVEVQERLLYENIKLDGMMYGVVDYFTLRDLAEDRMRIRVDNDRGDFTINDVRILLDPAREGGPPVAVFEESEALKVMSKRRKF